MSPDGDYDLVVVSNRLAVHRVTDDDGDSRWQRSPGGLVSALAPIMAREEGAWVGWGGAADEELDPFDHDRMHLVPVTLSAQEVEDYYEGFSNSALWPLYHDVIAPPEYHREWWDAYRRVNERFARAAASAAAEGATVWVQDYQLQLVPHLLRRLRPDVRIGFFNHIPFPPVEIFAQLPWRRSVLEGLLGADLIGFQRVSDAVNFQRTVLRLLGLEFTDNACVLADGRTVRAESFPISIDTGSIAELASDPTVQNRARQIRAELGDPRVLLLGADRLDYTKGIWHRMKAFAELLEDGRLTIGEACLVQVASPSRERVETYRQLREEVELEVGRVNGTHNTLEHTAIQYLHQSIPFPEIVALYVAADVMLVTALRDGMNLVAKEYAAAKQGAAGVLVLSEFAGAADQLDGALLVNPHDIDGLKDTIVEAVGLETEDARRRMQAMYEQVREHDVERWSHEFLARLTGVEPDAGSAA